MKIVGLMPARNEAWVIGFSARVALRWVDELVILCHACTDATATIAVELAKQFYPHVTVVGDDSPVWEEMRHRQALLELGRARGGTHFALIDADEVLTQNLASRIRGLVERIPPQETLYVPMFCPRNGIQFMNATGRWGTTMLTLAFKDSPDLYWDSATRGGYDFHQRHPMGRPFFPYSPLSRVEGGVVHLQFASERRLRAKQALYKMIEVQRWPHKDRSDINAAYNLAVYGDSPALTEVPSGWLDYPEASYLDLEAAPWQEAEVDRLWSENPERYKGLDLFGVPGRFKALAAPASVLSLPQLREALKTL